MHLGKLEMKLKLLDSSFFILASISILNVNGAVLMAVGIPQAGSPLLLVACLVLVWKLGGTPLPLPGVLLIATLVTYLLFAMTIGVLFDGGTGMTQDLIAYGLSILVLWAVMAYVTRAQRKARMNQVLRLVRNLSVLSAASVVASPFLYGIFQSVPLSAESRFGGFFGNPNEAGVIACAAVAMTLSEPFRSRRLQVTALVIGSIAAVLTFSKTAWLVLPTLLALHLMRRSRRNPFLLLAILAAIPLLFFFDIAVILTWFLNNPFFELNLAQTRRIEGLVLFLTATDETGSALSSRDFLWQFGFEQIMQSPLLGSGLGSFHHMKGGLEENEVWQGVHNTYLMVWGEAGLLAFALFVFTTFLVARDILFNAWHPASFQLGLIIFLNFQVNHNILTSRYFLVFLAVLVCLQTHPDRQMSFRQ